MNRALVYLAATPLVLGPMALGAVAEVSSDGSNLQVGGLVGVGGTGADSGGDGSATAGTVTVGDEPVVGGTQEGTGTTSGEVLTTGETPVGEATVGGFDATVEEGADGTTTSSSSTSLLDTTLLDGAVDLQVLSSESTATGESGSSSTDGVVLDVGGGELEVVLLHSDSSSTGEGDPFVASVNGEPIASSEQADGCAVDADPLVEVLCFTAEQGQTTLETEGSIADVEVVEDQLFVTVGGTSSGATEAVAAEPESGAATSSAEALLLPGDLAVSDTEATAGESASAGVVTVGGDPLLEGLGGTQEGDGTTSGELLDTGATPLGQVEVAPYEATVDGQTASSSAAVAEVTVIDEETLTVTALQSQSQAGADGSTSATQGVVVDVADGELEVVVLDSTSSSDGEGSASIATVNGEPVVSSEQADGCVLDAQPTASVACVTAEEGTTTIEAAVADVELVEDQLVVTVGGTSATPASATPAEVAGGSTGGSGDAGGSGDGSGGDSGSAGDSGTAADARAATLPFTGATVAALAALGIAAVGTGAGAVVAGRRRRLA